MRNQRGQTMVEYILLLAVVVSLVLTFYRSSLFQSLFGAEGRWAVMIKTKSEFAYRHGSPKGQAVSRDTRDGANHPSYFNRERGDTHFFSSRYAYP